MFIVMYYCSAMPQVIWLCEGNIWMVPKYVFHYNHNYATILIDCYFSDTYVVGQSGKEMDPLVEEVHITSGVGCT